MMTTEEVVVKKEVVEESEQGSQSSTGETKSVDNVVAVKEETSEPDTNKAANSESANVTTEPFYNASPVSGKQCYCEGRRDFNDPDLQCSSCYKWFHVRCITFNVGSILTFTTNYQFMCKNCNPNKLEEVYTRKQSNFTLMCQTTLANLAIKTPHQQFFSKEKEIIPFIEEHWEKMANQPRKTNKTWHTNIHKTLCSSELFKTEEIPNDLNACLANSDLNKIAPNYDQFRALASQLKTDVGKLGIPGSGTRKRKNDGGSLVKNIKRSEQERARLNCYGYPMEHPFNKDGYRYILAESDQHAPGRQKWDEAEATAGKPIPGCFYRVYLSPLVLLAPHDRAHQLKVHESQMSVTGEKGYSMIRATHSICKGAWYFEATITDQPEGSHARIGWSQMLGTLQAPCGYDKFSYSWRSRKGTVFHQSRGKHYADEGYSQDDVVGCLIVMPPPPEKSSSEMLPDTYKERPLIKFKNSFYFEEKDEVEQEEKKLKSSNGSKIIFYKNGVAQGVAFSNIYTGTYYPAISVYKNMTVKANFGPEFQHPPIDIENWKPMCDRVEELAIEQSISDLLYHVDNGNNIEKLIYK